MFTSTLTLLAVLGALAQLQTKNRKFPLGPSPPYSEESKGCVKQTLLSKIIYEDRFLCIRDQSSESRDQLRHPRGVKNTPQNQPKNPSPALKGDVKNKRVKNTVNQKVLLRKAAG